MPQSIIYHTQAFSGFPDKHRMVSLCATPYISDHVTRFFFYILHCLVSPSWTACRRPLKTLVPQIPLPTLARWAQCTLPSARWTSVWWMFDGIYGVANSECNLPESAKVLNKPLEKVLRVEFPFIFPFSAQEKVFCSLNEIIHHWFAMFTGNRYGYHLIS